MPTPITRGEAERLAALVDARLASVTYWFLLPASGPAVYEGGMSGLDQDLSAIVLDFAGGTKAVFTWAMDGELEGLALLPEGPESDGLGDEFVDASSRPAWSVHIGQPIESMAAAWQTSGDDVPESIWAVRLNFPTGSTVVALGTTEPELDYMPDELLVVFDESLAKSFQPVHVAESAWGHEIHAA